MGKSQEAPSFNSRDMQDHQMDIAGMSPPVGSSRGGKIWDSRGASESPTGNSSRSAIRALEAERDALREDLTAAREELDAMAGQPSSRTSSRGADMEQRMRRMQERHKIELEELERKNNKKLSELWDEHWQRVGAMQDIGKDNDQWNDQLREMMQELQRDNVELRAKAHANDSLAKQVADLEEEMMSLVNGVEEKDKELEIKDHEIEQLQRRLEDPTPGADDGMAEELHHAQQRIADLEQQVEGVTQDMQGAEDELAQRNDVIISLQQRIDDLEESLAAREEAGRLQEELIREKQGKIDNLALLVDELRERDHVMQGDSTDVASVDGGRSVRSGSVLPNNARDDRWERESAASGASARQRFQPRRPRVDDDDRGSVYSVPYERRPPISPNSNRREDGYTSASQMRRREEREDGYNSATQTRRRLPPADREDGYNSAADRRSARASSRRRDDDERADGYTSASRSRRDDGYTSASRRDGYESETRRRADPAAPPWQREQGSAQRSGSIIDMRARTPVRRREWEGLEDNAHQPQPEWREDDRHVGERIADGADARSRRQDRGYSSDRTRSPSYSNHPNPEVQEALNRAEAYRDKGDRSRTPYSATNPGSPPRHDRDGSVGARDAEIGRREPPRTPLDRSSEARSRRPVAPTNSSVQHRRDSQQGYGSDANPSVSRAGYRAAWSKSSDAQPATDNGRRAAPPSSVPRGSVPRSSNAPPIRTTTTGVRGSSTSAGRAPVSTRPR